MERPPAIDRRLACTEFDKHDGFQGPLFNNSMNKHMLSKVWNEITYPFPNFNGVTY